MIDRNKKSVPKDALLSCVLPEYKAKDFFDHARKQAAEERSVYSGYESNVELNGSFYPKHLVSDISALHDVSLL